MLSKLLDEVVLNTSLVVGVDPEGGESRIVDVISLVAKDVEAVELVTAVVLIEGFLDDIWVEPLDILDVDDVEEAVADDVFSVVTEVEDVVELFVIME